MDKKVGNTISNYRRCMHPLNPDIYLIPNVYVEEHCFTPELFCSV